MKAIIRPTTKEILSRGLDDYMVDYLFIVKKWNRNNDLEVINDSDIINTYIDDEGKQFLY